MNATESIAPEPLIDSCLSPGCGRVDTLDASGKCAACAPLAYECTADLGHQCDGGPDGEMCPSCMADYEEHAASYRRATPHERATVLRRPLYRCPSCDGGVEGVDELCFECAKAERRYERADAAYDDFKDRQLFGGE